MEDRRPPAVNSYVSSARNSSFLLLSLVLLSVDVAWRVEKASAQLSQARRLFAEAYAAKTIRAEAPMTLSRLLRREKVIELRGSTVDMFGGDRGDRVAGTVLLTASVSAEPWDGLGTGIRVDFRDGSDNRWRVVLFDFRQSFPPEFSRRTGGSPIRAILDFAAVAEGPAAGRLAALWCEVFREGSTPSKGPIPIGDLYAEIERELIGRTFDVRPLGLSLRSDLAMWVLAVSVLVISIMIRSRLREIRVRGVHEVSEPWLLIDGKVGLERAAAYGWVLAVALGPWLTNALLVMTRAGQVLAIGTGPDPVARAAGTVGLIVLFALTCWVSFSLGALALELRDRH